MALRQLTQFVMVVEERRFRRAAERLFMTQRWRAWSPSKRKTRGSNPLSSTTGPLAGDDFGRMVKSDAAVYAKIIKAANIRLE